MKLKDLIKGIETVNLSGDERTEVSGLSSDSRRVNPGDLFVAIRGGASDGADFVSEAIDRGAVAVAASEKIAYLNGNLAQVIVKDPRRALARMANRLYGEPAAALRLIGIIGTNGKSTVAALGRGLLQSAGISAGLLGTIYYGIGQRRLPSSLTTPPPPELQILLDSMRKDGATRAVIEVSSHGLKQERLAGCEFDILIFTNLSPDHLDYHPDINDYRQTKMRPFKTLHQGVKDPGKKTAIVNRDDPVGRKIIELCRAPVISYGLDPEADISASGIVLGPEGSSFRVSYRGEEFRAATPLLGRHNVYNLLAVIALGLTEGISLPKILEYLKGAPTIPGRLEAVRGGQDFNLLIDYAHTPDALENVITAMKEIYRGELTVVFGCGGDRDRIKRPRMGEIAARLADRVIITSDNPRSEDPETIIDEIRAGIPDGFTAIEREADRRRAIVRACRLAKPGDVVLIAGKGHEERQIFKDYVIPFSDREEALRAIEERN